VFETNQLRQSCSPVRSTDPKRPWAIRSVHCFAPLGAKENDIYIVLVDLASLQRRVIALCGIMMNGFAKHRPPNMRLACLDGVTVVSKGRIVTQPLSALRENESDVGDVVTVPFSSKAVQAAQDKGQPLPFATLDGFADLEQVRADDFCVLHLECSR
jgi:hypothetical protein